jgi:LPXTG-site transpeptidase (sortase) family protein
MVHTSSDPRVRRRTTRAFVAGAFAALGLALVVGGTVLLLGQDPVAAPHAQARPDSTLPAFVVAPATRLQQVPARRDPAAGRPERIIVPRLHVVAPVVPIASVTRTLVPPDDPAVIGWWSHGAMPGAKHGAAVLTGHTVHTGGGAFDELGAVRPGDPVRVRTTRGTVDYTVTGVTVYRKASLAKHADRVFEQQGPGRLVLVTCDDWDGTQYLSNAVVLATPLRR